MTGKKTRKHRILAVDDEDHILDILKRLLGDDFDIDLAETGEAALNLYKTGSYDLVIADLLLPGMDGRTMVAEMRKINENSEFIVLTGDLSARPIEGTRIFYKPYNLKKFKSFIEQILKHRDQPGVTP